MPEVSHPIVFRVDPETWLLQPAPVSGHSDRIHTHTRTLAGMQKEAVVQRGTDGAVWRMLCDEGPWLNGTDLAPFPLGFFAAGLASCLLADILNEAASSGTLLDTARVKLDIRFTMEGSILSGTMAAGVDSIAVTLDELPGWADAEGENRLTRVLAKRSVVSRALVLPLPGRFCLKVNGKTVPWPGNHTVALESASDPELLFSQLTPMPQAQSKSIIHKDNETAFTPGEGAVGLQTDQKRTVHIHSEARPQADGLNEIAVQCIQPSGSRFHFLTDETGAGRAPDGLLYLSAGLAFCFMTQLGRYAEIKKMQLRGYRIVQQTDFGGADSDASPAETAVFLDSDDTDANNLKMVQMGEQTCYLHTTMREPVTLSADTGGTPASSQ